MGRSSAIWLAFTVLASFLFLSLGYWQYDRYQIKIAYMSAYEHASSPADFNLLAEPSAQLGHLVTVSGHFIKDHHVLIDQQFHQGQRGYRLFTLFESDQIPQAPYIFVDRGWMPQAPRQSRMPEIANLSSRVTLTGHVTKASYNRFSAMLGKKYHSGWPKTTHNLVIPLISEEITHSVWPFVLKCRAGSEGAYTVPDNQSWLTPDKHLAYALQWFCFACVSWVMWYILSVRKGPHANK